MRDIFALEQIISESESREMRMYLPDSRSCLLQFGHTFRGEPIWNATIYQEGNSQPDFHWRRTTLDELIRCGKSYDIDLLSLILPTDPVTTDEYENIVRYLSVETQILTFQEEEDSLTYKASSGTIFIPLSLFHAAIKTYQEEFKISRITAILRVAQVCSWDIWSADENNVVHGYFV